MINIHATIYSKEPHKIVSQRRESWPTWNGALFDLLNSLDSMRSFLRSVAEPQERLKNIPIKPNIVIEQNDKWIPSIYDLATENIDPRLKEIPSQLSNNILTLNTQIGVFYTTIQPLLEKSLDNEFSTPLSEISKLVLQHPDYIDGNWAISVSYIALMDGFINQMRYRFKKSGKDKNKDANLSFQQRYGELQEIFHEKGIDVLPGDMDPSLFDIFFSSFENNIVLQPPFLFFDP